MEARLQTGGARVVWRPSPAESGQGRGVGALADACANGGSKRGSRWRRHTLPHRPQCSTICARRLNDRVRDETGCTPAALATNTPHGCCALHASAYREYSTQWPCLFARPIRARRPAQKHGKPSTISTGQLHALPRLHPPPIQLVVSQRSYLVCASGESRLEDGFPLRCFQRLSGPKVATQPCRRRDN